MLQVCRREKPYVYRGQGNRWDQYGESSSAAFSEAHITSEQVNAESKWGPWPQSESASRDKWPTQPYRLQKANESDGQCPDGLGYPTVAAGSME